MLNSGGANCFTGPQGSRPRTQTAETAAELLGVSPATSSSARPVSSARQVVRAKVLAGIVTPRPPRSAPTAATTHRSPS